MGISMVLRFEFCKRIGTEEVRRRRRRCGEDEEAVVLINFIKIKFRADFGPF